MHKQALLKLKSTRKHVKGVDKSQEPHKTGQKDKSDGLRIPKGVSRYTLGTWELKSVVFFSNAQPFERLPPIYNRVCEVPLDIPQGYVKGHSIYRRYVEEPHRSRVVVQEINDSSYVLRLWNTSLTYTQVTKIFNLKLPLILS